MNSRFICNYPENEKERISIQLFDFFCAELIYARSDSNHELWIISPWITESTFDLSTRGSYDDLWPGFTDSHISFSEIIKKFLDYGSTVNIVCKSPDSLIDIHSFYRYIRLQNKSKEIEGKFDDLIELYSKIPQITDCRENYNDIIVLTELIKKEIKENFKMNGEREQNRSIGHSDVISIIQDIKQYAPDRVQLYYNNRLHSKIIIGKLGALFGSSNITYSGLNSNDELMYFITEGNIINSLNLVAKNLSRGEPWKINSNNYSILDAFQKKIEDYKLKKILETKLPTTMKNTLEIIGLSTDFNTKNEFMDYENESKLFNESSLSNSLPKSGSLTCESIPVKSTCSSELIDEKMDMISEGVPISLELWSKIREWDKTEDKLRNWSERFISDMIVRAKKNEVYKRKQAIYAREVYEEAKKLGYK